MSGSTNSCRKCGLPADQHCKIEFVQGYLDRIISLCQDCYKLELERWGKR